MKLISLIQQYSELKKELKRCGLPFTGLNLKGGLLYTGNQHSKETTQK